MPKMYSLREVAENLKVSEATIRRLINDGQLRALKVRGQLRIDEKDLTTYLLSCRVPLPVIPVRQKSKNPCGYYSGMKVV